MQAFRFYFRDKDGAILTLTLLKDPPTPLHAVEDAAKVIAAREHDLLVLGALMASQHSLEFVRVKALAPDVPVGRVGVFEQKAGAA